MKRCFLLLTAAVFAVLASGCAAATPTAEPTLTPVPTTAPEPSVIIHMGENAQTELIPSEGPRVLIDVVDPSVLSSPATEKDILVYTHGHPDHHDPSFERAFSGQKLVFQEGEVRDGEVTVRSILSSHNDLIPEKSGGSNYIILVEMSGLRIAHFGDIGQTAITDTQTKILGQIDIAFTQLLNENSNMFLENRKGFILMEQLHPRMVIPLHGSGNMKAVEMALKEPGWVGYAGTSMGSLVRKSDFLTGKTIFLIGGRNGELMKAIYRLPVWPEPLAQ